MKYTFALVIDAPTPVQALLAAYRAQRAADLTFTGTEVRVVEQNDDHTVHGADFGLAAAEAALGGEA